MELIIISVRRKTFLPSKKVVGLWRLQSLGNLGFLKFSGKEPGFYRQEICMERV